MQEARPGAHPQETAQETARPAGRKAARQAGHETDHQVTEQARQEMGRQAGRGTALWVGVGGVVLVFTVLACMVSLLSWLGRQSETQRQEYRRPAALEIDVGSTAVVVQASESGGVEVERRLTWATGKPAARESWQADTLRLSLDCPPGLNLPGCSAAYRVWVPADLPVSVRTSSGEIRLADLHSRITVRTDSGDVRGSGLSTGDVTATGGSGDMWLAFNGVPGHVVARTSAGDITVTVPRGRAYDVRADATDGAENVEVGQNPSATPTIEARTDTADITIGNSSYAP